MSFRGIYHIEIAFSILLIGPLSLLCMETRKGVRVRETKHLCIQSHIL
jgi:hypothetical protein